MAAFGQNPQNNGCPLKVYLDKQGRTFDSRFHGKYRVTEKTLLQDVSGGCKETGATSSVTIYADEAVKPQVLERLRALIKEQLRPGVQISVAAPATSR